MAHQTRGQVTLWVRNVGVSSCVPGEGALPVPPPLQVELVAPLGSRKLVNGATGQPVPQFSARLPLQPGMLPPGYRLWQVYSQLIGTEGHPVVRVQLWYHPRIEGAGQLITESTDSPFVPRPW